MLMLGVSMHLEEDPWPPTERQHVVSPMASGGGPLEQKLKTERRQKVTIKPTLNPITLALF
jgi:hypothetical protein